MFFIAETQTCVQQSRGLNLSLSGDILTFNMVGPVTKLQGENVIDRSAGVQCVGVPVVADESVLSSQDQHGSVDQFQSELLVLTWKEDDSKIMKALQREHKRRQGLREEVHWEKGGRGG